MTDLKVNIGCGRLRVPGYVGVDMFPSDAIDVLHDLRVLPWPFDDNSVDHLITWHCLEHLPGTSMTDAVGEIHRILKPGAEAYIKVPYGLKPSLFNPYHHHAFDEHSFDGWCGLNPHTGGDGCLQLDDGVIFTRRAQKIVSVSGFPVWHIVHKLPWTEGILFTRDIHRTSSWIPSRVRELREWLVKR